LLRNTSGPKKEVVHLTGDWRKSYNEERQELYSSPNIIRVVKSRRIRWTGHIARRGGTTICTRFEHEADYLEDLDVQENTILKSKSRGQDRNT
jgi:hypothetical protein